MIQRTFLERLSLVEISEGLTELFPYVSGLDELEFIADGFSSYAVRSSRGIVFRVAKNVQAMEGYKNELRSLPRLQSLLKVRVPNPSGWAKPSEKFPFGVITYEMIPGIPFSLDLVPKTDLKRVARDLVEFLATLHSIPPLELADGGVGGPTDPNALWETVLPVLQTHLTEEAFAAARSWRQAHVPRGARHASSARLIHGDPWGENILLNETLNGVVGVIDFETLGVGDVAQDFAAQKYVGQHFLEDVIGNYTRFGGELGNGFPERLRWFAMLRELVGLAYAVNYPDPEELADSLQKVRGELTFSYR